jgi:hypothetical protein
MICGTSGSGVTSTSTSRCAVEETVTFLPKNYLPWRR